ncbi:MAG: DUF4328 domain-containing protein [Actinomycetia bacterium]|nr:DUF4328 domain-containing protein [Actinomycetes bacterium]
MDEPPTPPLPPPEPEAGPTRHYRLPVRPIKGWAKVVQVSVGVQVALTVTDSVLAVRFWRALAAWQTGDGSTDALWAAADAYDSIWHLQLGMLVLVGAATTAWLYRLASNTAGLRLSYLTYPPAWAIWGWVVPVLNLARPLQMVRQTWEASTSPVERPVPKAPQLINIWWGLLLLAGVLRIWSTDHRTVESVKDALGYQIASNLVWVTASIALILIVGSLTRRQSATITLLETPPDLPLS